MAVLEYNATINSIKNIGDNWVDISYYCERPTNSKFPGLTEHNCRWHFKVNHTELDKSYDVVGDYSGTTTIPVEPGNNNHIVVYLRVHV